MTLNISETIPTTTDEDGSSTAHDIGGSIKLALVLPSGEELTLRRWSFGFLALVISVFFLLVYFKWENLPLQADYMLLLATASFPTILSIVLVYLIAQRVYDDTFYLMVGMGWFSNLLYVALESLFPELRQMVWFVLITVALSIASTIFFYAGAFFSSTAEEVPRRIAWNWTILWIAIAAVTILLAIGTDAQNREITLLIPAILFSTFTNFYLARSLQRRLIPAYHRHWGRLVTWPIYFYAGLQPFYLLTLWPRFVALRVLIFYCALTLKFCHGTGLAATLLLTSSRRTQQELEEGYRQQQTLLEERDALTAGIEHEMRNPLGAMETQLELMRGKFQSQLDLIADLDIIEEQRQKILGVCRFIPVLRGGQEFYRQSMEQTSVRSVISRSIRAVQAELSVSDILLKIVDARGNGEQRHSSVFYTWANPRLLEQAIINILKNSVEAIREARRAQGRVLVRITSDPSSEGMVRISISDNGCGILAENIPRVQTLFTTKKDRKPNSGIGLFVTSRILRLHRGRLEINSNKDEGTEVILILPKWARQKEVQVLPNKIPGTSSRADVVSSKTQARASKIRRLLDSVNEGEEL